MECSACHGEKVLIAQRGDYAQAKVCGCQRPCPRCHGKGYIFTTDEVGYRIARQCVCTDLDRRVALFNEALLPSRYADATFGRIHIDEHAADMKRARARAWRFVREYEPGMAGLLFHGPTGTGKTHLSIAVLRYLILERGVRAVFREFMHLLSDLRAGFGDRGRAEALMSPLVTVPVLVIDELGKGRGSDWELNVLDELISKRYNAERTTLFTTNYPLETTAEPNAQKGFESLQERIGHRIHSRLMEMCDPIRISGRDFRRLNRAD
ncbi:MAG: ATP-binding protein [Myxococcota bacterium]|nr:ATP-binding protein [Myxococcota bacterium]